MVSSSTSTGCRRLVGICICVVWIHNLRKASAFRPEGLGSTTLHRARRIDAMDTGRHAFKGHDKEAMHFTLSRSEVESESSDLALLPRFVRISAFSLAFLLAWLSAPQVNPSNHATQADIWVTPKPSNNCHITGEYLLQQMRPQAAFASDQSLIGEHRQEVIVSGIRDLPREGRLMDLASVIDHQSKQAILEEIHSVEMETGTELQVVVIDDIGPPMKHYPPKTFATWLFNSWQIGPADKNNGVLILVVLKQRRVEIEVGKGLNTYMTSEWCSDLLKRETVPWFKVENYGQGTYNAVFGVAKRLREVDSGAAMGYDPPMSAGDRLALAILLGLSGVVGVGITAGITQEIKDRKYPMGKGVKCSECGGTEWIASSGYGFMIVEEPTDEANGLMKRVCTCTNCGQKDFTTRSIPKYDGKRYYDDGSFSYYRNSDSSGGSGGSSDGGGGGGASW